MLTFKLQFHLYIYRPILNILFASGKYVYRGPGRSVGIATDYVLDGSGSNPRGDEIFRTRPDGPGDHPASCKMGTRYFPGVKCGRGVLLTTHLHLASRLKKE